MRLDKGEALSGWRCLDSPWRRLAVYCSWMVATFDLGLSRPVLTDCCGMFRNTSQMRGSSVSILTVHGCGCTVCGRDEPCDGWSLLSESTLEETVDAWCADTDLLQINKVCLKQGRPRIDVVVQLY